MSDNDKLGFALLNEGGNVVETEFKGVRLAASLSLVTFLLSFLLESGLFVLLGFWAVL